MKFKGIEKKSRLKKKIAPKEEKKVLEKKEIQEVVEETIEALQKDNTDEKVVLHEIQEKQPEPKDDPSKEEVPTKEEEKTEGIAEVIPVREAVSINTEPPSFLSKKSDEAISSSVPEDKSEDRSKESLGTTEEEGKEEQVKTVDANPSTVTASPSLQAEDAPLEKSKPARKVPFIVIFLLVVLLGAFLGGAVWYLKLYNLPIVTQYIPLVKPTPTPSPTPSPTPTPIQIDLSKYTITVLNGSGISGEAAKAKAVITAAGFSVDNIGNATTSDNTDTIISAKASVDSDYLTKLSETLSQTYTVSETIKTAPSSQTDDVVITIGSGLK